MSFRWKKIKQRLHFQNASFKLLAKHARHGKNCKQWMFMLKRLWSLTRPFETSTGLFKSYAVVTQCNSIIPSQFYQYHNAQYLFVHCYTVISKDDDFYQNP